MNKYVIELRRIFKIFLLMFIMLFTLFIFYYIDNKNKIDKIKDEIKQIRLDYQFLKYNKEQLEELK